MNSVIQNFQITAADGKSYSTNHYSLEMIIAVGFKVNSERAVQFRKWVNQIAKDYTIKGWVMDDERLKNSFWPVLCTKNGQGRDDGSSSLNLIVETNKREERQWKSNQN